LTEEKVIIIPTIYCVISCGVRVLRDAGMKLVRENFSLCIIVTEITKNDVLAVVSINYVICGATKSLYGNETINDQSASSRCGHFST